MSWGAEEGHGELKGVEYLEKELSINNFKTVDILSGFILESGENPPEDFLSLDSDLKEWLLKGKIKALAKNRSVLLSRFPHWANIRLVGIIRFRNIS